MNAATKVVSILALLVLLVLLFYCQLTYNSIVLSSQTERSFPSSDENEDEDSYLFIISPVVERLAYNNTRDDTSQSIGQIPVDIMKKTLSIVSNNENMPYNSQELQNSVYKKQKQSIFFNRINTTNDSINILPSIRISNSSFQYEPSVLSLFNSYSLSDIISLFQKNNNHSMEILKDEESVYRSIQNGTIYGAFSYYKPNTINLNLFEEQNTIEPKLYYQSININKPQYYQYSVYNTSVKHKHDYYRYTLHSILFPRTLHFSFISIPRVENSLNELFNPYFMVGFIKSQIQSFSLRNSIRNTFATLSPNQPKHLLYKFYFLLGIKKGMNDHLLKLLLAEQYKYNDLIISNIIDSYQNVTLKVFMAEELFITSNATSPYVYIGDDDTCLKTKYLIKQLESAPRKRFYKGKCVFSKIGEDDPHSKHGVSKEAMPKRISFSVAYGMVHSKDLIYRHQMFYKYLDYLTHIDDGQLGIFNNYDKVSILCEKNINTYYPHSDYNKKFLDDPAFIGYHNVKSAKLMNKICGSIV
ncbi:hypothetical protein WA158_004412 [Blastocystis sp. Blastoise]